MSGNIFKAGDFEQQSVVNAGRVGYSNAAYFAQGILDLDVFAVHEDVPPIGWNCNRR